jgi:threonine synthase
MGEKLNFSVPTGNFGDILAGWYAKQMGLPVGRFVCASNANNVLTEFITTGIYDRNRPFFTTVSPSMDILVSSNLERLLYSVTESDAEVAGYMKNLKVTGKYEVAENVRDRIQKEFFAGFCSDAETLAEIGTVWNERHYLMDTHTAVGYKVLCDYRAATGDKTPAAVVSTASPYKFCDSVLSALEEDTDEPGTELIGKLEQKTGVPAPAPLRDLAGKPVRFNDYVEKDRMRDVVENFVQ